MARSRSRSFSLSPAPPPTTKRTSRAYTPTPEPERNVKQRTENNNNDRNDGTPPRRDRSVTPPRPGREGRSRTPPRPSAAGGGDHDRWANNNNNSSQNTNIGPPRGRSLSPLRRTRAQSPSDTAQYSLILPLPHSRIPSLLIGLKGATARSMQTYAGLSRLTFRGAGTGKGSNGNEPPIAELRGSRRAIEDGLWAIARKAQSHNQRIDTTFKEDQLVRVGGGGGGPPPARGGRDDGRAPPPRDDRDRDRDRDGGRDRAPPSRRDDTWASENRDRNGRDGGRDAPPPRRDAAEEARPAVRGNAPLTTADFTLEIPSLALSGLYSHLPKLRSTPGIDKITLKQGASSFIYVWGSKSAQDSVMQRVDESVKGVYPSWRDAAQRAESGPGWDRDEQPVRVEIARAGPIPDRARRASPPPARRRSSPPPSARGRSVTPPRRAAVPQRERESSPDPKVVGRYVAGLSEARRDEWTAAFVQASGLPYAEVKKEGEADEEKKEVEESKMEE